MPLIYCLFYLSVGEFSSAASLYASHNNAAIPRGEGGRGGGGGGGLVVDEVGVSPSKVDLGGDIHESCCVAFDIAKRNYSKRAKIGHKMVSYFTSFVRRAEATYFEPLLRSLPTHKRTQGDVKERESPIAK